MSRHYSARQTENNLGHAAGVRKTYAMLEAARQRKNEGVDVVIGYVETHYKSEMHLLRVNINNLRRKIELNPARSHYLLTESGIG